MQRTSRRLRQVLALAAAAALLAVGSALATVDPTVRVSPTASPFGGTASGAACQAQTQTGTNYPGAEVEPFVDVNLTNADNLVGTWQQDRWSNGGSTGQMSAYSTGRRAELDDSADPSAPNMGQAKFSRCTGGNAENGGDYERATDPWVSFSPNGVVQQITLGDQRLERRQRRARVALRRMAARTGRTRLSSSATIRLTSSTTRRPSPRTRRTRVSSTPRGSASWRRASTRALEPESGRPRSGRSLVCPLR